MLKGFLLLQMEVVEQGSQLEQIAGAKEAWMSYLGGTTSLCKKSDEIASNLATFCSPSQLGEFGIEAPGLILQTLSASGVDLNAFERAAMNSTVARRVAGKLLQSPALS